MIQSLEQVNRRYEAISRKIRRENNTPEKARALLLKMGILEKDRKSANGVRLAKRFR